ncbi:unnamed protein product [Effrenium voratum]|uniref:Uncharacterized protein n=1 Tax=Effrenium voratum TaxID=2562239 RepID=A0AA36NC55_9DINO|nr:unnamed protein product [Effrenium voratum]CAJ1452268.1 unnamed protein product [Effrenium voratum]
MLRLMCAMTMVLAAEAAHGLDNNWTVMVTGMKDGNGCMKATSVEDMGSNLVTSTPTCLSATQMCTDDYECTTARALKPTSFTGCTFDESTAAATSAVGLLMDGLCYNNFVVEQKNFNGAPGLAPDKVHVRSEAHLHTRACLVVSYCAKTGFYLVTRPSSSADYAFEAQMDSASAEKVFDFLIEARHPCGTTTTTTGQTVSSGANAPALASLASAMSFVALH